MSIKTRTIKKEKKRKREKEKKRKREKEKKRKREKEKKRKREKGAFFFADNFCADEFSNNFSPAMNFFLLRRFFFAIFREFFQEFLRFFQNSFKKDVKLSFFIVNPKVSPPIPDNKISWHYFSGGKTSRRLNFEPIILAKSETCEFSVCDF